VIEEVFNIFKNNKIMGIKSTTRLRKEDFDNFDNIARSTDNYYNDQLFNQFKSPGRMETTQNLNNLNNSKNPNQ